jgi:prepilin-type processing-associated H-X9-DG protein
LNNLKQMQLAWNLFATDNDDRCVTNGGGTSVNYGSWVTGWLDWDYGTPNGANTDPKYLLDGALGMYTARSLGTYRCPADKIPSLGGPRNRSISMNGFVGDYNRTMYDVYALTAYRVYLKTSAFTVPGPAKTWVFVDEHPDGINDGLLGMKMPSVGGYNAGSYTQWDDVPASYHNGACGLSFADGHAEIKKWLDVQTKPPVRKITSPSGPSGGASSPRDNAWLVQRTSAPN